MNSYVIKNSTKPKTIIFHNSKNFDKIKILKKRGVKLVVCDMENDNNFDLKKLLKKVFELGIGSIKSNQDYNMILLLLDFRR